MVTILCLLIIVVRNIRRIVCVPDDVIELHFFFFYTKKLEHNENNFLFILASHVETRLLILVYNRRQNVRREEVYLKRICKILAATVSTLLQHLA